MNSNNTKIRSEALKTIGHINMRWQKPNKNILKHVFPLLSEGQPVTPYKLAEVSGYELAEVEDALYHGRTERDHQGRVAELFGVMFVPTMHRIEIDGIFIFSCCALIAHTIPGLINKNIIVESVDPISRKIVKLAIGPEGIHSINQTEAVATLVTTELNGILNNVSANFCTHIHHFVSRKSAEEFIQNNPRRYIIEINEFHEIGRQLAKEIWNQ